MKDRTKSYREFYAYYLTQHEKAGTRIAHFVGTLLIFAVIIYVLQSGKERFLWYIPILGYGIPWLSHFIFERKKPAAFRYPLWCFLADFQLFFELLTGKIKFKNAQRAATAEMKDSVRQLRF